jgi:hypothetical protein
MVGAFAACIPSQSVQTSDVLTLSACPADAGTPCSLASVTADGVSLITFEACIPTTVTPPVATGQSVTLQTSAGSWQLPTSAAAPTTFSASLSGSQCVQPALVAPSTTLAVQVQATLDGYTQNLIVPLGAAALGGVTITAVPPELAGAMPSEVALTATVRGQGVGLPTAGTTVAFTAVAVPGGTYVAVTPQSAVINASGQATATLVVAPGAESVTVTATATGPASPVQATPPTANGTIEIDQFVVPDAGTAITDAGSG